MNKNWYKISITTSSDTIPYYVQREDEPCKDELGWIAHDLEYMIGPSDYSIDCEPIDVPPRDWLEHELETTERRRDTAISRISELQKILRGYGTSP